MPKYPHCDQNVLHAPGDCEFCDMYPDEQKQRQADGVNFTGQHVPGLKPCPSEKDRDLETIERWPGNRAVKRCPDSRYCFVCSRPFDSDEEYKQHCDAIHGGTQT